MYGSAKRGKIKKEKKINARLPQPGRFEYTMYMLF